MYTSCNCDTQCPQATDCTCIEIILSRTAAHCFCECQSIVHPMIVPEDARVNLDVRRAELGKVASFVSQFTDRELMVPVRRLREKVALDLENVTFAEAVQQLGLVFVPSERIEPPGTY